MRVSYHSLGPLQGRRTRVKKFIAFLVAVTAVIALVPTTASAKTGNLTGLYNQRYCEIFAVHLGDPSGFAIDIFNTIGLNDCPPEQWNSLDWDQVKEETGAIGTKANGPRRWVIDAILGGKAEAPVTLAGLDVRKVAVLNLPTLTPENYTEMKIARTTTWMYRKGRPLHFLVSPDGRKYALQAYTTTIDKTLRAKNLSKLGSNPGMGMPEGWTFKTIRLKKQLKLPAFGVATILRDGLEGTYQKFKWPKNFFKPVKKPKKHKQR
jgi:hypothetical protein